MSGISPLRQSGQWIDLSQLIQDDMPVYPGDPPVRIRQLASHADDGYQLSELAMSCHTGTHLDAPRHYLADGAAIDQLDPDQLILTAWVTRILYDSSGYLAAETIDWSGWRPGDALLLAAPRTAGVTNESALFSTGSHCHLLRQELPLLGANLPTFVEADDPLGEAGLHRKLLGSGTLLLENLNGLEPLTGRRVDLIALPLRIAEADGSPARVLARMITCNPASDDI